MTLLLPGLEVRAYAAEGEIVVLQVVPSTGKAWRNDAPESLRKGERLQAQDVIRTDESTWLELLFLPSSQVWVGPGSSLVVGGLRPEEGGLTRTLQLLEGLVRVTLGHLGMAPQRIEVEAAPLLAAPRGTDYTLTRREDGSVHLLVHDGLVDVLMHHVRIAEVSSGQKLEWSGRTGIVGPVWVGVETLEREAGPVPGRGQGRLEPAQREGLEPTGRPLFEGANPLHNGINPLDPPVMTPRGQWEVVLPPPAL